MNREAQILLAMQSAAPSDQRALAIELHRIRTGAAHRVVAARDMTLADEVVSAHLTPVVSYERHTSDTDWLGKVASVNKTSHELHTAAKAEATNWFRTTHPMVRADAEEFGIQARGYAELWSGGFDHDAASMTESFVQQAMHLAGHRYVVASDDSTCATCGKPAQYYCFQEGTRASGSFACESHVDRYRDGRTVEKIGSKKVAYDESSFLNESTMLTQEQAQYTRYTVGIWSQDQYEAYMHAWSQGKSYDSEALSWQNNEFSTPEVERLYNAIMAKIGKSSSRKTAMGVTCNGCGHSFSRDANSKSFFGHGDMRCPKCESSDLKQASLRATALAVGDRVKYIGAEGYVSAGAIGVVVNADFPNLTTVKWDDGTICDEFSSDIEKTGARTQASLKTAAGCSCAHNNDGSVTTFLCSIHADNDPCATMAAVTGGRRKGSIVNGVCTSCGWSSNPKQGSLKTAGAAGDGQKSFCRLCGKQLESMEYSWYALKSSPLQRDVGQHYCVPARYQARSGEFGPDGKLAPGSPGGEGGQYDAPAGYIFDAGANAIHVGSRRTAAGELSVERGVCAICDQPMALNSRVGYWLHVDHNGMYASADHEADPIYTSITARPTIGSRSAAKGESADCATCDGALENDGKRWKHSDSGNNDHGPVPKNEDGSGKFPVNSSRRTAGSISDPQHSWTLAPDDEFWIGNFTDDAINGAESFWSSDDGAQAQPYLPGYADEMLRMIRDEKTRRTGSRRTALSVTNVGVESDTVGTGTLNGQRIRFTITPQDAKDLRSVLFSDLAVNFSGVDIEQGDIITTGSRRTVAKGDWMVHLTDDPRLSRWVKADSEEEAIAAADLAHIPGAFAVPHQAASRTAANTCTVCGDAIESHGDGHHHDNGEKHDHEAKPGKESSRRLGYETTPGFYVIQRGTGTVSHGGPYSSQQEAAEAAAEANAEYKTNEYLPVKLGSRTAANVQRDPDDPDRTFWDCNRCGGLVERYRGDGDVTCPKCDAEYNAAGQQLRDDWRGNESYDDDDMGDMEGFERQQLRNEGNLRTRTAGSQSDESNRHEYVGTSERCRMCGFTANHVLHASKVAAMTPDDWDRFYNGDGVSNGVPRDLFPEGGVPLHGELTPEQQAWMDKRSSKTAVFVAPSPEDAASRPWSRGESWSLTCPICKQTETGADYYNGWPSQDAFHNHLFCGHDPGANYDQNLAIDRYSLRSATASSKTAGSKSNVCPKCGSQMDDVVDYGDELHAHCSDCGWDGMKKKAELEGPDPAKSQDGYAESGLPNVTVDSAPEDSNLGWIEGMRLGSMEAMFMGTDRISRTASAEDWSAGWARRIPAADPTGKPRSDAGGPETWGTRILSDGTEVRLHRGPNNHIRFYDAQGNQRGEEQNNVAPAFAYSESEGWSDPGSVRNRFNPIGASRKTASDLSAIERWCDSQGLVMKDFPDDLIERAAASGDTSILDSWLSGEESLKTAASNDKPAGAAPQVDQTPAMHEDSAMFEGEWSYADDGMTTGPFSDEGVNITASLHDEDIDMWSESNMHSTASAFPDQPVWRFTMSPSDGTAEDLRIMLRDGYDAEDEGSGQHEGNDFVYVDYRMSDEVAQGWYDTYPNIGAQRIGKVAMAAPGDHGVDVGDIYYCSWGYDQTNVDFFEVVGLTPAGVKLRPIQQRVVTDNGSGGASVIAVPGAFTGEPMTKRLQVGSGTGYATTSFNINSYSSAFPWDGTPKHQTSSGWGH